MSSRLPTPGGVAARSFRPASAPSVGGAFTAATAGTGVIGW